MRSLVLVLVASTAVAQTTDTTLVSFGIRETPTATSDQLVIGSSSCGTSRVVYWVWNQLGTQACNNMRIWATENACGNEPATGDKEYASVSVLLFRTVGSSGSFTVNIDELPGFEKAGTTTPCGGASTLTKEHKICASVPTALQCGLQNNTFTAASALRVIYDAQPPNAPIISEVLAQDKALKVAFSVSSDTTEVIPFIRPQGSTEYAQRPTISLGTGREVIVDGLLNATTYDVVLRAIDGAGNQSADSEPASGTPRRTIGFWGTYREAGGTDTGGCSSGLGLAPLFALGWFFRRRTR
ncbi:MAG: hypothetical protein Q8L14_02800 [Myxococcales bacterium]|nr:hypothetical protein [Myxococcales bacterium]